VAQSRPTKAERKEASRLERDRIHAEMSRRARMRRVWIAVGVVALVGLGALIAMAPTEGDAVAQGPPGVQDFVIPTRNHVDGPVEYEQTPSAGGDHSSVWLNCGAYDAPVPTENAVHSMEHGAAWITYSPGIPAEEIEVLRSFARDDFIVVSPFVDLPAPIVASTWGHQLQLDGASDEALSQFIRAYRLGPDTPELGAICSGGVGSPA
jgi:hypothetical protein